MSDTNAGTATAAYILDIADVERKAQQLRQIFAGIRNDAAQATTLAGPSGGGAAPKVNADAAAYDRLQRAQAGLEQQQARLARSSGDDAGAMALEAQAVERLTTLLNTQAGVTSETIAIERQLLGVQQQSTRAQQQRASATEQIIQRAQQQGASALQPLNNAAAQGTAQIDQLGAAFKSGLLGVVGPAAVAGVAIGALKGTVDSFQESLRFKAELDQNTASITAQLRGLRDSTQVFDQARQFADRYKLTQEDTTTAIQASVPLLRQSKASLTDVLTVLSQLQVLKPEQGIQGAAFALAELQGGQTRSLATRFNIPIAKANELKQEIAKGGDAVQVLGDYLTKAGIGAEALEARTKGVAGALNDAAVASENVKIAQGNLAASSGGIFVIQGIARQYQGLANLLNGDAVPALQTSGAELRDSSIGALAYATALAEGKSKLEAFAAAQEAVTNAHGGFGGPGASSGGTFVTQEDIKAQNDLRDASARVGAAFDDERRAAAQFQLQTGLAVTDIKRSADASTLDAAAKELQAAKTKLITDQNKLTTDSFLALNPNMDASGAIATAAAQGYDPLIGKLAATQLQLNATRDAQIALNNAINAQGVAKTVATDRFAGRSGGRGDSSDAQADADASVAATKTQTAQTERQIDAQIALAAAHGNTAKQIDLLRQKGRLFGKDEVDRQQIEAQIISLEKSAGKTRVSAAATTGLQLAQTEESSQAAILKAQREGQERLRDQQEDFDVSRARGQEDEAIKIRRLLASGQRGAADRERQDFAREQQRKQEDFNRERGRTLRNNAESTGDIDTRTDLRQSQIGQRAALRGVRPAGGAGASGVPGPQLPIPDAPPTRTQPIFVRVQIAPVSVQIDGHQIVELTWPEVEQRVDTELAETLRAVVVPSPSRAAVAGSPP